MPLYMKMSQNINKTTRHLKFRYISILTYIYIYIYIYKLRFYVFLLNMRDRQNIIELKNNLFFIYFIYLSILVF